MQNGLYGGSRVKRRRPYKVLVAMNLATESGRDILTGIFNYARESCHWRIDLLQVDPSRERSKIEKCIDKGGYDGAIYYADRIVSSALPQVVIGYPESHLQKNVSYVRCDDTCIGEAGAKYLMSLGDFSSYVYIHSGARVYWQVLREKGFRAYLRRCHVDDRFSQSNLSSPDFAAWLVGLQHPVAVMASCDAVALEFLERAVAAGIKVPGQMTLLGVDDDRILCDFANPPLSSIRPDHVRLGETAALMLNKKIHRGKTDCRDVKVSDFKVVERESTKPITPSGRMIRESLAFIRRNAKTRISAARVAAHLKVSRRLLDLRMTEQTGETVAAAILRIRIECVAERLKSTNFPIATIASDCGFENPRHLANAFRRQYGVTMTAYRER